MCARLPSEARAGPRSLGSAHEGDHPGRRHRHAAAPDHAGDQQAADAGLRQADDLLPAVDADAGRDPRGPGHHHARTTRTQFRAAARRRLAVRASSITYAVQPQPDGLAQAFVIGADFIGDDTVGAGPRRQHLLRPGPRHRSCAGYTDVDGGHDLRLPGRRPDGVRRRRVRRRTARCVSIEEKPTQPEVATTPCPGLYFYDNDVVEIAREPEAVARAASSRSPTSTTPTSSAGDLPVEVLPRGTAWLDTGTFEALIEAAKFVHVVEERQGLKIGCVEEVAWRNGWIDDDAARAHWPTTLAKSGYGAYLAGLLAEAQGRSLMEIRPLAIDGACEITPRQFPDDRGVFLESFRGDQLAERRRPPARRRADQRLGVARGTVRGIHFADVPPSQAKYVTARQRLAHRLRRRPPGRLADLRAVGLGAARHRRPARGLPVRGPRPRVLRPRGRHDRHVPVLGGLQPRAASTASTRSTRGGAATARRHRAAPVAQGRRRADPRRCRGVGSASVLRRVHGLQSHTEVSGTEPTGAPGA